MVVITADEADAVADLLQVLLDQAERRAVPYEVDRTMAALATAITRRDS